MDCFTSTVSYLWGSCKILHAFKLERVKFGVQSIVTNGSVKMFDCFEWVWQCDRNLLSMFVHWCANHKTAPSFMCLICIATDCEDSFQGNI